MLGRWGASRQRLRCRGRRAQRTHLAEAAARRQRPWPSPLCLATLPRYRAPSRGCWPGPAHRPDRRRKASTTMSADDVGASPPARGAESVAPTPAKACPGPRCNGPQGVARLETVPFRPRSGTASGMLRAMESTRRDRTAQRSVLGACAVALVLLATGGAAWGDEGPQAATTAEALFRDGRRLMAEGRYAEACPKFVAVWKLAATTGTALN